MKTDRTLPSYKPAFVDEYILKINEKCAKLEDNNNMLKETIDTLEKKNNENLIEIERFSSREKLISHTIFDATNRLKQMEADTKREYEESKAEIKKMEQELINTVSKYKEAMADESQDHLRAVTEYIESLNKIYDSASSIEDAYGTRKARLNLDELNKDYDLGEMCKEMGLMGEEEVYLEQNRRFE